VFGQAIGRYAGKVAKPTTAKLLIPRLRELRKRHSLTQEQFSEISGVAYKYYQMIEIGKRIDLRLSTLEKLARAYGIGVHELLGPSLPKVNLPKSAAVSKAKVKPGVKTSASP
jgi:transcriptional regulator with XRE-family HTH domain